MAKRLKKEKVNVDVINFGEEVFSHQSSTHTHTLFNIQCAVVVFALVWSACILSFFLTPAGDEHREADGLRQHAEW